MRKVYLQPAALVWLWWQIIMTQAFTKWEKTAPCYSYICIYIWLLRCYYCSVVRISDFPNGRIVVITFMEPPHLLAQCALKFDLLCPNICMRWGLSPNITLHIPTLINRKILFVGLGRRGKESKHHSGRNPRKKSYFHEQKWIPSWLICLASIANLLT